MNEEKEKHFVCYGELSSSVKVRKGGGQNRPAPLAVVYNM